MVGSTEARAFATGRRHPFIAPGAFDRGRGTEGGSQGTSDSDLARLGKRQRRKRREQQRKRKEREGEAEEGVRDDATSGAVQVAEDDGAEESGPGTVFERGSSPVDGGRQADSPVEEPGTRGLSPALQRGDSMRASDGAFKDRALVTSEAMKTRASTASGGFPGGEAWQPETIRQKARHISPEAAAPGSPRDKPVEQIPSVAGLTGQRPGSFKDEEKALSLCGSTVGAMGRQLVEGFRRVLSLCSQSMEGVNRKGVVGGSKDTFPLPTHPELLHPLFAPEDLWALDWVIAVCMGLNSLWGCRASPSQDAVDGASTNSLTAVKARVVQSIIVEVRRLAVVKEVTEEFEWNSFFRTRGIDYKGDEVKTALTFTWRNICPALPREIGVVQLEEICEQGCKYYVQHFPDFLKPQREWGKPRNSRVMVRDSDWAEVAAGLIGAGVFGIVPESEVFRVDDKLLLNGLFGVEKHEAVDGVPIYRLIMNLVPLNGLCQGMSADIGTLPHWFGMSPFHLEPHESLVVSSEDLRCFFYTLGLPKCWYPFLCFNKALPESLVPPELRGQVCYPCSKVLPMGFLNSVGIAQHVHRVLVDRSQQHNQVRNTSREEIRKDKVLPDGKAVWRVYLDNYDLLEKYPHEVLGTVSGEVAPEVAALRQEYLAWGLPRHPGKAVSRSVVAEVQGAVVDGTLGVAYPKGQKLSKYMTIAYKLVHETYATQKQMQVVCGGLVYFSTFRRQLLGGLNMVWSFIESFKTCGRHHQVIPLGVKVEIYRFLCLVPLCRMSFRLPLNPTVTCSDASTQGGGVCVARGLTNFGAKVALGEASKEVAEDGSGRVFSIGLFDGIGCLRVALDLLGSEVAGHICVEKDPGARRVVEHHFPDSVHYDDIEQVGEQDVKGWSLRFGQVALVLIGAGPPCQGVSGLNSQRKGALKDDRSSLFTHVQRIRRLVQSYFPWSQVHCLMESVASMDETDKVIMSSSFGDTPWEIEAGSLCWCNRPRLYWITWELTESHTEAYIDGDRVVLIGHQPWSDFVEKGWRKVDGDRPFPTFTTSRPRSTPGHRPAGLQHCDKETVRRWEQDKYRFPPYQYLPCNCLVNKHGHYRLPSISEREFIMGLPVGYTQMCAPKSQRKSSECNDKRLTLVGNSWAVPIVAWLIGQLLSSRGVGRALSPSEIMDRLMLDGNPYIHSRLMRPPLNVDQQKSSVPETALAAQLGRLVSTKGADLMFTAAQDEVQRFQRLRHTVNAKMWTWQVVSGWKWHNQKEHINSLELRAILACLRWRVEHLSEHSCRILHLTDSLVCLHSLTRGRTSSRRLRRTLCRINSLLLAHDVAGLWGYVHTDLNPADKASRWSVRTKFRHAKSRS